MPAGGTFFVFSDYMRGAVRLAALSQYKSLFVWTHDSVGLGEDGPTHQPIEQLAAMRAMPGLRVIRPADANEVSQAWRVHVDGTGPTALILTRQKLPVLGATAERAPEGVPRGAYTLVDEEGDGLDLVLIGTGSEVSLCVDALDLLDGLSVRVVSMPSWDLFAAQSDDYREQVLPADVPTLAVEAARHLRVGALRRRRDRHRPLRCVGARSRRHGEVRVHPRARRRARPRAGRERSSLTMSSAIARLNDFGQSPWYDNLARPLLTGGGLAKLVEVDGIRGVTSNPTILDKAIGAGEGYDDALGEVREGGPLDRGHVLGGRDRRHPVAPPRCCARCTTRTTAATASCRSRWRPRSPTTPTAPSPPRARCTAASTGPNLMIKIPATLEGIPAIEETIASGITVNVTLIFSLDRHDKVIEAYLTGLERFVAGGRRPVDRRVGGVVLREPGRHRDRPPPPRGQPAAGQGRGRQRQARVRAVPGALLRPALGRARGEGCAAAAAAVGVDVDEEPGLLPHPLRRRAHRSRHRQHARAGVDRGAAARRGQPACGHRRRGRRRAPAR